MFTQCEKCKAIFRVSLREVTVAKGKLRCGECYSIFDATQVLSNTVPNPFQAVVDLETIDPFQASPTPQKKKNIEKIAHTTSTRSINEKSTNQSFRNSESTKDKLSKVNTWLSVTAILLFLLLPLQFYFNMKFKETEEPLHEPEKIQMLNYNVFAHPNESGVLLISATMENIAKFKQPYPVIELRLSDSQSKVIALRRFRPYEYLPNQKKDLMLAKNQQSKVNLKINDPGSRATRFQFKFY